MSSLVNNVHHGQPGYLRIRWAVWLLTCTIAVWLITYTMGSLASYLRIRWAVWLLTCTIAVWLFTRNTGSLVIRTCTMGSLSPSESRPPSMGGDVGTRDVEASSSSNSVSRRPKRETSMRQSVATTRSPPFSLTIRCNTSTDIRCLLSRYHITVT